MSYFFESSMKIPVKKRILLKRMLMGLTSYYPIDRTSIVDMPQIVKPERNIDIYKDYEIVKELNIELCLMSQLQFEKYIEVFKKEKSLDAFRKTKWSGYNEDDPYHYQIRTRQTCNMVYREDDFRIKKMSSSEIEEEKEKVYSEIISGRTLKIEKELRVLSPKLYRMMFNINKFVNEKTNIPKGKILFYSDFRSDAGAEALELVLRCNGYEKFNTKNPEKTKGKRYTFITGKENADIRKINKENYYSK